ncbi:hypothetical protein JCGZ_09364 [Jatropha curcas]|uniref:RRM domain-containing protein n=1 Tax=Jatropha curcas TaxID=180498 RepID=A0A067KSI9_JATCU|nr:UBP1-associated protein 2B isoform X1 [Jatropha curcas]XP_020535949.1 UBP1-associated protein 2B isoform X2 [Jatropha curcas]KDP35205.1 hypothetical protein JCGZ_09364 [Jatropha curcas]
MAKTQKPKKIKLVKVSDANSKQNPLQKPNLKKRKSETFASSPAAAATASSCPPKNTQTDSDSDSDSSSNSHFDSDPVDIPTLLEPYTKEQLIELISIAATNNPSIYPLINEHADRDASHRKIFVHGFTWDTTRENVLSAFEPFGEIEECNVVTDKVTGKAKGYGFVLFKTRKGAAMALKDPKKNINNRFASCQLASIGPAANVGKDQEVGARKIYVSNVQVNADKEKLKAFLAKFGEIESGPIGFDKETGRSRGYALFVYKTVEGAKRALEEPHKMFEGQQLHCSIATEGKNKTNQVQMQQQQQVKQQSQDQMLAAVAAAQNLALFGQQPGINPVYGGLLSNPAAAAPAGMINPLMVGAVSQSLVPTSQIGGLGLATQSVLGTYGAGRGLQHVYSNTQTGQGGVGRGQGLGSSFAGYPPYM